MDCSCHGGRVRTLIPNKKGKDGLDETLVPTDIGKPGTRYLRDTEMAMTMKKNGRQRSACYFGIR